MKNGYCEALTRQWGEIADMRLSNKDEIHIGILFQMINSSNLLSIVTLMVREQVYIGLTLILVY